VGAAVCQVLELSGIGRVMADGTVEDDAHLRGTNEWVIWETGERSPSGGLNCYLSFVVSFIFVLRGPYPPSFTHSAPWVTDFICLIL